MENQKPKIFNDSIHGYIEMHPLCVAIIDTEQFQRLRWIKQMGGTYLVYPGASHNRFEHSLGTCYLAGYFVGQLRKEQIELGISDKDELCVKIAGLCHDLGHGPLSHMFDNDFIPIVRPGFKWSHEDASEKMFDHLVVSNPNVAEMFEYYELGVEDKTFIKRLMTGETPTSEEEWNAVGRGDGKRFLFEIVANKINGIDVDKFDYFARDCRYLGIKSSFDHMRCIKLARVIKCPKEGYAQICFRDSAVGNIYDMFHTRLSIHKKACQHKTVNAIEMMMTDALKEADNHIKIGKDGIADTIEHDDDPNTEEENGIADAIEHDDDPNTKDENGIADTIEHDDDPNTEEENGDKTISTAMDDMVAYTKLTDHVFHHILYSKSNKLQKAKKILQNVEKRNLYKFIGYTIPKDDVAKAAASDMKNGIFNFVEQEGTELEKDDVVVQVTSFSYGGGVNDTNPVDKVRFYSKDDENASFKIDKDQVSRMLPRVFFEKEIRVYCKRREPVDIDQMKKAFNDWCAHWGYKKRFHSYEEPIEKLPVEVDTA